MKRQPWIRTRAALVLTSALLLIAAAGSAHVIPAQAENVIPAQAGNAPTYLAYLPTVATPLVSTPLGVQADNLGANGGLAQVLQARIGWLRVNSFNWSAVEPMETQRHWNKVSYLEQALITAAQRGVQVILGVRGTPDWARKIPGASCGPIKPEALPAFAAFMRDMVARYSVPPYSVKYYEIWNEPDVDPALVADDSAFGCWGDPNDPYYGGGVYAQMLQAIYPQMKAADPAAQVLVGGLLLECDPGVPGACSGPSGDRPPHFLEGILAGGGAPYFDGVAFHAYDYFGGVTGAYGNSSFASLWNTTGPVVIAKARFVRSVLSAYGVTGKYLMNTESALICGSDTAPSVPNCSSDPLSPNELTKAYYAAQVYAAALAEGLRVNTWYSVMGWRNSNLLNADLTPRPVYTAMLTTRTELGGATFTRAIDEYPGVKGYAFRRAGAIWLVWSLDGSAHTITLPSPPAALLGATGQGIPVTGATLQVGLAPIYVKWGT